MNRTAAFLALFADPQGLLTATEEHVAALRDNPALTDEDEDNLPSEVIERVRAFQDDPEIYFASVNDPAWRALLEGVRPAPPIDLAPPFIPRVTADPPHEPNLPPNDTDDPSMEVVARAPPRSVAPASELSHVEELEIRVFREVWGVTEAVLADPAWADLRGKVIEAYLQYVQDRDFGAFFRFTKSLESTAGVSPSACRAAKAFATSGWHHFRHPALVLSEKTWWRAAGLDTKPA